MYSLNVPVPGAVRERAWELRSQLTVFERLRDEHTLVIKRLDARTSGEFAALERATREEVAGTAPFEASITGIGHFESPPAGPSPVVYLAVESPPLERLHRRLVEGLDAVPELEGDAYRPHITLARGTTDHEAVEALLQTDVEPVTWTVDRLVFWDARRELATGTIRLPA